MGTQAFDYVQAATGVTKAERIATLACLFTGTGLLSQNYDPVVNAGDGSFIFLVGEYVSLIAKNSGAGFIFPFSDRRRFLKFTFRQERSCQLALTGILIISIAGSWVLVKFCTKVTKFSQIKLQKTVNKIRGKNIIAEQKVQFILVAWSINDFIRPLLLVDYTLYILKTV